jgi:galactokinase
MDLFARKNLLASRFQAQFGRPAQIWTRSPGRVDLMGSHTDYNLGYVMTMTVDRDTWIAAAPRADEVVSVVSLNLEQGAQFSLAGLQPVAPGQAHWSDYVRAVAWVLQQEGLPVRGWDGLIHSTVPFGSGLSSSAALEMAAGMVFQAVGDFSLDPVRHAQLGQRAENQFVGVNCGILDQYSSTMGQSGSSVLLDCRDLTSRAVPIDPGIAVVIGDTRAQRSLAGSEYGERRAQCEAGARILSGFYPHVQNLRDVSQAMFDAHRDALPAVVAKRCRFIIEENQRVLDLAPALSGGDRHRLAALYAASYAGARDLYEIGAPAMQHMLDAMLSAPGIIGARQAGAGFGGCLVALVEAAQVEAFAANAACAYAQSAGIQPSVFPVQAAPGSNLISF